MSVMPCRLCKERGKIWSGAGPTCAFDGVFSDNRNCATLNALRDICYEGQDPMPCGVDYRYCDDQKYATINIDSVEMPDGNRIGLALWVTWYKRRVRTEAVWVLTADEPPRLPTEAELLAVIEHFRAATATLAVRTEE